MKRMLNNQIQLSARRSASSSEMNTISVFKMITERRKKSNWKAGTPSVTQKTIERDFAEMDKLTQVAATKEPQF